MSKTTIYIGLIVILLAANLFLWLSDDVTRNQENESSYFDQFKEQEINRIEFSVNDESISLKRESDYWTLNDEFKADQGFVRTLISVLKRVETGRRINNFPEAILGSVQIDFVGGESTRFEFATNSNRTKSYFVKDGIGSEVAVPGYSDNIIDIFMLHPDQWKDRLVFDGSWRTIQKLVVEKLGKERLEIRFDNQFFLVNNENPSDSSVVVDYLNQYQYFEANERITPGRFPQLDSLAGTIPIAVITIEDIKVQNEVELIIFPSINGQAFHLVKSGEDLLVIDASRIGSLLPGLELFMN